MLSGDLLTDGRVLAHVGGGKTRKKTLLNPPGWLFVAPI